MKIRQLVTGALVGLGLNTVTGIIFWISSLLTGLPFIPFIWFEWLTRVLPGALITNGIETMVSMIRILNIGPTDNLAKLAEQLLAVLLFLGAGLISGGFASLFGRAQWMGISLGGFLLAMAQFTVSATALFLVADNPTVGIGGAALALWLYILWSVAYPRFYFARLPIPDDKMSADLMQERRTFFRWMFAGAAGLATILIGYSPGLRRGAPAAPGVPVTGLTPQPQPALIPGNNLVGSPSESELTNRIEPAPGTRPELTSIEDFYRIDINLTVPEINASNWKLDISGLIDKPVALTLEDIQNRPSIDQVATLSCISNYVGGDLIGTAVWTGTRVKDLLEELHPAESAAAIEIKAEDGFYESVPIKEAMDDRTLLVYSMNGEPLLPEHGFPLRIFIPNHYGMKQPKWINSITVVDKVKPGFWVERGWDYKAIPQTTSVVDTVAVKNPLDGKIPIGGIAWAGARGIQRVEVQIDEGEWLPAQLRTPSLSGLAWVQWRYDWEAVPGDHLVRVRAVDGLGDPQKDYFSDPHPSGATGIHSKLFVVS